MKLFFNTSLLFSLFGLLLITLPVKGQLPATQSTQIKTVQPKIMVIPFAKEGEDIRTVLESDFNKQIAVAKVKEAFDGRGFTTVDFTTSLKRAVTSGVFTKGKSQTDLQTEIAQMGGADIFVSVNSNVSSCGNANIFRVILEGNDTSTGNSLSNKIGDSPCNATPDLGKLAQKAIEACIEDFLNVMNRKFDDIVQNGVPISINVGLGEGASISDLGHEISQKPISELIEEWFAKNAYKNDYNVAFATDVKMLIDPVKIPLRDQSNQTNYNATKFSREFEKYLQSLGLKTNRVVNRNQVFITIK